MRLFEAILDANHRALAGDSRAGLHPSDFPDALPLVALSCIDPRLNHLFPQVLGIREEDFIWLRNAGNVITDSMSSTTRSLALACAIKGGKEIAIIGHSDCRLRQVTVNQLIDTFRALGISRTSLPDNLVEFFGLFASERQNVINSVDHVRRSPLISPKIAVHGLMVEIESGRLEWIVNGYEHLGQAQAPVSSVQQKIEHLKEQIGTVTQFNWSEIKFPEVKIGDLVLDPQKWRTEVATLKEHLHEIPAAITHAQPAPVPPAIPPKAPTEEKGIPIPSPIRMVRNFVRPKK
jgi:carbonic anhydrase